MADDDWNEVDVEAARQDDDKVEYEVEEEATATEEKAEPVQAVDESEDTDETFVEVDESAPDPDPVEAAPELEGVDTDGAQKRIRQLVRQRKEREEQIIAQQQELAALQARLQETEQKNAEVLRKTMTSLNDSFRKSLRWPVRHIFEPTMTATKKLCWPLKKLCSMPSRISVWSGRVVKTLRSILPTL